jgi:hypothetical protein
VILTVDIFVRDVQPQKVAIRRIESANLLKMCIFVFHYWFVGGKKLLADGD